MKKYDEEKDTYWEVNFYDIANKKLIDLFGNVDSEDQIDILSKKALEKGYDTMEVIKVTRETTRFTNNSFK